LGSREGRGRGGKTLTPTVPQAPGHGFGLFFGKKAINFFDGKKKGKEEGGTEKGGVRVLR